jgi:hypothetical protein
MEHASRFFSTLSGTDKTLMLLQYSTKFLVNSSIQLRPQLHTSLIKLSSTISDFRILLRFNGLPPLLHYATTLPSKEKERFPRERRLLKLQVLANLLYYPLEHAYWLGAHEIIPMTKQRVLWASLWSCRFWALYVLLQFVYLYEEYKLLKRTGNKNERAWKNWRRGLIINACYAPLTVHWSVVNSTFPEWAVGCLGTVAALVQWSQTWEATSPAQK